jgi:hypothetical protein
VPTVTFVGSSAAQETASVWVGFGGISGNLLQAGTDSTVGSSGNPSYIAWFQTVPDAGIDSSPLTGCHVLSGSSPTPCNVSAGDTLSASGNSAGKRFGEARDWGGIFADAGRFRSAETAPFRVSGGKATESQRLFRRRLEAGMAQDCVVGLAGLERAITRLF